MKRGVGGAFFFFWGGWEKKKKKKGGVRILFFCSSSSCPPLQGRGLNFFFSCSEFKLVIYNNIYIYI